MLRLVRRVLAAERLPLRALHGEERARERGPERRQQYTVVLEIVEGSAQRRRIAADAARGPLPLREGAGIDEDGLAGRELSPHAIQSRGEEAAEREVRIRRRVEPVTMRHAAHRLAVEHLTIGGIQRGGVTDRELLLPVSELRIVLLDLDPLRLQRRDELVDDRRRRRHPGRGEAEALVERGKRSVGTPDGERELALERRADAEARRGARGDLPLEERAGTRLPRRAVERAH